MTATPCSVKSVKSESLNGSSSWVDIDNESPFHLNAIKNTNLESKNSSFEKIMLDVQNELINLSMSSNSSCKEQLQQINQKLNSKGSDSLQVDAQQFKLDQLETFEDERLRHLNPNDFLLYWDGQNDLCKENFFNDDKTTTNLRQWCVRRGIFSKEVLSLLVLSNVVSVVLGVGIGYTALIRRFL